MSAGAAIVLDRDSVREVDRSAIEEYGIPGIVLMENAARGLAVIALDMLRDAAHDPPRALVVCGRGNNGGDGYALARHLVNAGVEVRLAALGEPGPASDAGINASICRHMGMPRVDIEEIGDAASFDLIVDAIFGTGLDRPLEGAALEAVRWLNCAGRPVLAVDVPSGLDCDTGRPLGDAVRADRTATFVAMKSGLLQARARPYAGRVEVVDIGAPRALIERLARRV
jgi:NAD(P)H-hydrate epimerase